MSQKWLRAVLIGGIESLVVIAVLEGLHLLFGAPLYTAPANSSFLLVVGALWVYTEAGRLVVRRILGSERRSALVRSATVVALMAFWYAVTGVYFLYPLLFAVASAPWWPIRKHANQRTTL